ncbi:DUF418 domain-containing protein [Bacillus chungangensis]|uniref:DUF418 domain-containing protein n=1 Tax=Bacillus chungangensis TaxID=587633 RepID=A0ABT9WU96_9BACI|nr:DUF418 domain-containing protein [Bacillus chungangensis]MDQ0176340.1 uncharacterized protein [Bacillus chungangensis]
MNKSGTRIQVIDGIRGFSLIGILMANMLIFQFGIWGKEQLPLYSLPIIEEKAFQVIKIVFESSFIPIFTFLFGYGMIKMKESLERKDLKVKRYFARRSILLLILGLLHGTFLWEGDILLYYGINGLFLLMFLKRKKKTMLIWMSIAYILASLIGFANVGVTKDEKTKIENYAKETITIYGSGSYMEIMDHRNNADPIEMPEYFILLSLLLIPILSMPMFLFGMYAAKSEWFHEPNKHHSLYRRLAFLLIPIGIIFKCLPAFVSKHVLFKVIGTIGGDVLAIGYIFGLAAIYASGKLTFMLRWFESMGKISLTNYLMQTIICTTIFYGYGFGLFGKVGVIGGFFLAIIIFAIQVAASHWYLKRWRTGPVEKILRMWTNFSWNGTAKRKVPKDVKIDVNTQV